MCDIDVITYRKDATNGDMFNLIYAEYIEKIDRVLGDSIYIKLKGVEHYIKFSVNWWDASYNSFVARNAIYANKQLNEIYNMISNIMLE